MHATQTTNVVCLCHVSCVLCLVFAGVVQYGASRVWLFYLVLVAVGSFVLIFLEPILRGVRKKEQNGGSWFMRRCLSACCLCVCVCVCRSSAYCHWICTTSSSWHSCQSSSSPEQVTYPASVSV